MKKGRHRRFEEARALKQTNDADAAVLEPCAECGAEPDDEHASWCMATAELDEDVPDTEVDFRSGAGH